jgi:uncharacterized membrane protein SpoIIM required for sporulation
MISNLWIETRKPHWERLEALIEQCGNRGASNMMRDELREFGLLYRQIAADLSTVRQDPSGSHYSQYLNRLLGRAHSIIYTGQKASFRTFLSFLAHGWPCAVWRLRGYVAFTVCAFVACGFAGCLLTLRNPDFALQVLGPGMIESIEHHEMWTKSIVAVKPLASSAIMTNNLSVCFITFAAGITGGLGTIYMIAFNGLLIGVIGAACATHGMSISLWSFVVGHGSLELPAIFFAGAAGFRLGAGLLFPGQLGRQESIRVAGTESAQVVLGTIPLLIIAGLVEGFISPLSINAGFKFALGSALFLGLATWILAGKRTSPRAGD